MLNKRTAILLFVLLTITSVYAASPEQPNSTPQDPNSLQFLIDNANKGDANAQISLGRMYRDGKGVTEDYKEAIKWYTKAAEQGDAWAQISLGEMYRDGKVVPQDYKEAIKWYTKAAEQGEALAQGILGVIYYNGEGVPKDYKKAAKWFTMAAEQGDAATQGILGSMYRYGDGVTENYKEAFKWYTKAAEQGDAGAQFHLGTMYYDGKGVPQDYKEAVKWFTMAAEQGYAYAQLYLGRIHYNGDGVPQDCTEAYKWVLLAQMNGEDVSKLKQDLTAKMTPVQIAEAQKLAKEFGAKNNNAKNGGTIIEPNSSEDVNKDALSVERLRDKTQKTKDSKDETKDVLRVERLRDKIQKMKDAIALAETQILNLPRLQPNQRGYLEEKLAVTERKHGLLCKEEANYNQIIRLAERYHDLGVDVMAMKKLLIKCKGRIDDVKSDEEELRKSINQQKRN